MRQFPRILFFINGPVASDADYDESATYGPNVSFRNASMVSAEGALEKCDGVAGEVPARYEKAYPSAKDAIVAWQKQERDRRAARAAERSEQSQEVKQTALDAFQGAPEGEKQPAPAASTDTKGWKAN